MGDFTEVALATGQGDFMAEAVVATVEAEAATEGDGQTTESV
jgi:hypothetical protein